MALIRWDSCLASVSSNSDWEYFFSCIYNPKKRTGLEWFLPWVLVKILQHQLALGNFSIQQPKVWNRSFILPSYSTCASHPRPKARGDNHHHFCVLLSTTIWSLGPLYLAVAAQTPGRRRCTHCSSSACAFRTRSLSGSWAPRRLGPAKSGGAGGSGRSSGSGNCENEEGTHNPCKEKKRKQRFGIRWIPNISWNRKGIFKAVFKYSWGRRVNCLAHWRQNYMITLAHCFGNTNQPGYNVQLIL